MSDLTVTHREALAREESAPPDAAFFWNAVLLNALLRDDQKPKLQREQGGVTRASRAAAIVHAAIHDAVNGVERRLTPYLVQDRAPAGAMIEAAAAGAGHATLVGLYPSQRATFDGKLAEYLGTLPATTGRDVGVRFGTAFGNTLLMARQHDGRNQPDPPYLEKPTPGEWRRDPIAPVEDQIPPLTPGWGSVRPFTLDYGPQLRPVPYPLLTTGSYAAALNEVRNKGSVNPPPPPEGRTDEQTEIARFWSYDDLFGTPVRLYNQHTREILRQRPLGPEDPAPTLHTHARIFALVNLTMADAGIGCWDAKYAYNLWRPVHAIRLAGDDKNPDTTADPTWTPLGRRTPPNASPPFPAYPSGHSTFGTTTFAMLRKFTSGKSFDFTLPSDELPDVRRSYKNLSATDARSPINENGRSRIFLGVHFNFDDRAGRTLGEQIANHIWPNFLRPVG